MGGCEGAEGMNAEVGTRNAEQKGQVQPPRDLKERTKAFAVGIGPDVHRAPRPAVAAIRPALGDELFAAERAGSGASCAADDVDDRAVYEHCPPPWCGVRSADAVERGTRKAERGTDPRPPRAVRIDATVIATSCPASRRSSNTCTDVANRDSTSRSSQNVLSSASSSTIPILARNSLRERARRAAR